MQLFDQTPLNIVRRDANGYLVASARAARTGIYQYRGAEVGRDDLEIVRVYRPADVVFKKDTLRSFTSLDVTLGHPTEMVDSSNWSQHAVGFTGEDVARDGEFVRVPLTLRDHRAIAEVESGNRQLSFGYYCDLEFKDGVTPGGEPYDAIQRNLKANHLAIVPTGRAGSDCRIGDSPSTTGGQAMPGENQLRTIDIDGIPVRTNDDGARTIETLQGKLATVAASLTARDAELTTLRTQVADRDKTIGARDAEITSLKQAAATIDVDKLAAERAELFAQGAALGLVDAEMRGKSRDEIVKLGVSRMLGDAAVVNRDPNYLLGQWDFLAAQAAQGQPHAMSGSTRDAISGDPIAGALRSGVGAPMTDMRARDEAWNAMNKRNSEAWKPPTGAPVVNGR